MEVFNISQDDDESDTSQEDLEDELPSETQNANDDIPNFQSWKRIAKPPKTSKEDLTNDFRFFLLDCDFGLIATKRIRSGLIPFESNRPPRRLLPTCKEQSYVRLHGISEDGSSVCCNVFGFLPYFFAFPSVDFIGEYIQQFKTLLTNSIAKKIMSNISAVPFHDMAQECPIVSVELYDVRTISNIYDFQMTSPRKGDSSSLFASGNTILKITCSLPKFVWTAGQILKSKEITFPGIQEPCKYEVYESAINHSIRFLADTNISTCSWLECKTRNYFCREGEERLSHAQIEVDAYYENISKVCPGEDLADEIPPIRILSIDIECMTRPQEFRFPKDGSDRVLQIGNVLATYGNSSDEPLRKVVFALGKCDKSGSTEIFSFDCEGTMLKAWRLFVQTVDPDILTGYNIRKFDIPYLIDRANRIGVKGFPFLGRVKTSASVIQLLKPGPKRMYAYDETKVAISGRLVLDMFPLMIRHNPLPGKCSLAAVAARYLKTERKIDVHYTEIFKMQNLGSRTRRELAEYCIQDAVLPYLLILNHNPNPMKNPGGDMLRYYISKARETGIPLKYLLTKSKDYCTYFKQVRTQKNPVFPFVPETPSPAKPKKRRNSEPLLSYRHLPYKLDFND